MLVTAGAILSGSFGVGGLALSRTFLPAAVAVGVLAHIAGDMLTKEGCPLLYPFWKKRFHVLSLTTEGPVERLFVGPALGAAAIGLAAWQAGLADVIKLIDWDWVASLLR